MADGEKSVDSVEAETCSEMVGNLQPEEPDNEFEVEKIVSMAKVKGKKTLYRVRWLGYGPDHDTWEPYENLESCREMIDQFIKNQQKKKKAKYKKKTQIQAQAVPSPSTSSSSHAEKKAPTWKYVTQDEEEYDTLKDKFWRDLEQGKVDVFKAGDMYSKVKASGRASRPKSFADMFKSKLPIVDGVIKQSLSGRGEHGSCGRGRPSTRGRRKRQKSAHIANSAGPKRVRTMNRGRGIRGRPGSGGTTRELSVYAELQESSVSREQSDSVSITSCDTLSSTDMQNMGPSEDSSHGYQMAVREEIVGVVPICSPDNTAHFNQVSLEKEQRSEVDLLHRADGTTGPSSVASSTATSASSTNESGIVADSCPDRLQSESGSHIGDVLTPRDCTSTLSDGMEAMDFDHSIPTKYESDASLDSESARSLGADGTMQQLVNEHAKEHLPSDTTAALHTSLSTAEDKSHPIIASHNFLTHVNSSHTMAAQTSTCQHSRLERRGSCSRDSMRCPSSTSSTRPPVKQMLLDSMQLTLSLQENSDSEQMPLNQIQPTIGNLVNDKSSLNNNKGETGDEEFEFDLDEFDPSELDGKMMPKMPLPDVLELSDAELHHVVEINDYECLVRALQANRVYDLEQPDRMGVTLVMIAAQHGFNDVLELLVLKGADVNSEQKNGTTALMLACEQGLRCTVVLLLLLGAHMNKHSHAGETALIKAVKCGHRHVVKELLDHGANFASPYNMDSPLKFARQHRDMLDLFNTHISRVTAEFEHQVQITLNNTAQIICALFPMQCFALREAEKIKVIFKHELQPTKPGVGMLLFIAHARITGEEVRCRFYGPCAVLCTVLNGVKLDPLTEGGNFVMSFCPLHNGKNELELLTAKAPTSEAKLIVCAYKAQLIHTN